jgi:hypothetical protein
MGRNSRTAVTALGSMLAVSLVAPTWAAPAPPPPQMEERLAALALPFVENTGQSAAPVAYYASTFAGTVFVTHHGQIVYALPPRRAAVDARSASQEPGWSVTESFVGGHAAPVAQEPSPTNVSFFVGNEPARWRAHVPTAAAVTLGEVYPGIGVTLKAYGKQVEKVFTVQPGAAPTTIRVRVAGAGLAVDADGALALQTGVGTVRLTPPVAYQDVGGRRERVPVAYEVAGDAYSFRVGRYDAARPLVIDPLLQATYLGGSDYDFASALALNATTGEVYVAGYTASTNFPGTTGGAQSTYGGSYDAFVARLTASLTTLDQATYLGGSDNDEAYALALNATTGEVYVAGYTYSSNFPGTSGGAQSTFGGTQDAFVARLNASLTTLDQATYLGGSDYDAANALALNATTGEVYVAGYTTSTNLPGTSGGAQSTYGGSYDAFVARFSADLAAPHGVPVPTLDPVGLVALGLLLAAMGLRGLRRGAAEIP